MNRVTLGVALLATLMAAVPTFATTTVFDNCGGSCGWQTGGWVANNNGFPYWDNPSADGANRNVGHYISGTGFFSGTPGVPGDDIPWYGQNSGGGAAQDMYFSTNAPGYTATLRIEIAGLASSNIFGWYARNANGTLGALTPIFAGNASAGAVSVFTPSALFGFYITTGDGFTYYTESSRNPNPTCAQQGNYANCVAANQTQLQHFALFRGNPSATTLWIGAEDRTLSTESATYSGKVRYGDYNDMIIKMSESPIPEPSTYVLFGAGLVGLGLFGHRRRKNS